MRNYFLRYNPSAKVNYLYLFMLYGIAEYDKKRGLYNKVSFNTKKELAARLKNAYGESAFSYATLTRLLKNSEYNNYFSLQGNTITLNNNFSNITKKNNEPFIIVTNKEADFLIKQQDSLLAAYYCYIKYYCGKAAHAGIKQDFTAKQFLLSVGLSAENHNNLSRISSYNTLLSREGLIKIAK